jgi:prephenate dehydratase
VDEVRVKNALRHLEELADFLRVLGCYRPATR